MYMYVSIFCVYTPRMAVYVLDILWLVVKFFNVLDLYSDIQFLWTFLKSENWFSFIWWDSNLSQDSNNVE